MLSQSRVCIVGLGLMGGSLAMALRDRCAALIGCDIDQHTVDQALARGVIDCGSTELASIIDASNPIDLLILAAPVGAMLALIPQLPTLIPGPFHLLDLVSTKSMIVDTMQHLPERISPIGGHPMCGRETSGLAAAHGDLFRGSVFVLTPLARTPPETLTLAQQVTETIGARSLLLDPKRHDRLAAAISHVPYLTSVALIVAVARAADEMAWSLAASGFRDSTRLAESDVTMMIDIMASNRRMVLDGLARVQDSLGKLARLIEQNDVVGLQSMLEANRTQRAGMFR